VFTYRLHLEDGTDAGQATYPVMIQAGEEIIAGGNQRYRVVDVVPIDREDSKIVGMLQIESA
jgi:hypothetical protein